MFIKYSVVCLFIFTTYIAYGMDHDENRAPNNNTIARKSASENSKKILKVNIKRKTQTAHPIDNENLFIALGNLFELNDANIQIESIEQAQRLVRSLMVTKLPESGFRKSDSGELFQILYRGCRYDQLAAYLVFGTAGACQINSEVLNPSEEQACLQVGEYTGLTEFTNNKSVLNSFGTNGFYVAFKINNKYLTLGSASENGFVCSLSAPVQVMAIMPGRCLKNY